LAAEEVARLAAEEEARIAAEEAAASDESGNDSETVAENPPAEDEVVKELEHMALTFEAEAKVYQKSKGQLWYGDVIKLEALVITATQPYTVIWESLDPASSDQVWREIGQGDLLEIEITEISSRMKYRITVAAADGQCISSSPYMMPEIEDFWIVDGDDFEDEEEDEDYGEDESEEEELSEEGVKAGKETEAAEGTKTEEGTDQTETQPEEATETGENGETAVETEGKTGEPTDIVEIEVEAEELPEEVEVEVEGGENPEEAETETGENPEETEAEDGENPEEAEAEGEENPEETEAEAETGEHPDTAETAEETEAQAETGDAEEEPAEENARQSEENREIPAESGSQETAEESQEEALNEVAEEAAPVERKVIVHTDLGDSKDVYEGQRITLTGELIGYEGINYRLQWYMRKDGVGDYIMIEGADQLTFTYRVTRDNFYNTYYLGVIVMDFTMSGD